MKFGQIARFLLFPMYSNLFVAAKSLSAHLRWTLALCVGLLCCGIGLVVWLGLLKSEQSALALASMQMDAQKSVVEREFRQVEDLRKADAFVLPERTHSGKLTNDLGAWADKQGVQINRVNIAHSASSHERQGKVQLDIGWSSGYASGKQLLGMLMDRYDSLAVERLRIQPLATDPNRQTWEIALVLYVRD